MKRTFLAGLLTMALVLVMVVPASAEQRGFPEYGEIEYEQSVITIPLYVKGVEEPAEILKLDAYMMLVREEPARNGLGYRQFEFTIADWELIGFSELLDAWVTFSLSDTIQPKSLGISLQKDSDYPAMIVYSAIYDIYIDGKRIVKDQPGVAFAKNVFEVPPRNITVAFEKPFSGKLKVNRDFVARVTGERPSGVGSIRSKAEATAEVEFDSGTCEDMLSIGEGVYREGIARGEEIRGGGYMQKPTLPSAKKKK